MVRHLQEPQLEPCPGRDDMPPCQPEPCVDWSGYDCCNFWKESPNNWETDVVRTDLVNPEKFQYDTYRYQLYAKPSNFNCRRQVKAGGHSLHEPGREYIPPHTDVRGLQQTTYIPVSPTGPGGCQQQTSYIPVLPTKPGGERDVTFPMTARTMGQPDVTTACCVPVMPCQPGFENMTQHIKPTAQEICSQGNYCNPPQQLQHNPCQSGGDLQCAPPSNVAGGGCLGLPDTFPQIDQRHSLPGHCPNSVPNVSNNGIPHYTGAFNDGTADAVPGAKCMNVKSIRYHDRVSRLIASKTETPQQWDCRIHEMYGHFGSHLTGRVRMRKQLKGTPPALVEQGNGFHWNYPQHENNLCYVLERNCRC